VDIQENFLLVEVTINLTVIKLFPIILIVREKYRLFNDVTNSER